jgi:hypothetical protein
MAEENIESDDALDEEEPEPAVPELDEDDLEEDDVELVVDDDDDDSTDDTDDAAEEEDEEPEKPRRRKRADDDDEDEDDDILSPDDVEADLDRILKDRMVAKEDEEDEDDDEVVEERTDAPDRLQPKRADETLCSNCFLLVRSTAPGCPVGDDDCPVFA